MRYTDPYRAPLCRRKKTNENKTLREQKITHVVVYLTLLTGPLRIKLWSQDRGSYTKINWEPIRSGEKKGRKQTEGSGFESSLQRASSPVRNSGGKTNKQKRNKPRTTTYIIRRVGQERQPYKQCKATQIGRQGQGQRVRHTAK